MPSPFPGMDPYLEDPAIFPDLHDSLIFCVKEALNARLPPPYYTRIGTRVWVEATQRRVGPDVNLLTPQPAVNGGAKLASGGGVAVATETYAQPVVVQVPREEMRETFLEIHAQPGGERLVTTIEILSLANKTYSSHGREPYLRKQEEVLNSQVHLVEIDLLRGGVHSTAVPLEMAREQAGDFDYHVCVHRYDRADEFLVYPILLPHQLPVLPIPLLPDDPPVPLALQPVLDRIHDVSQYQRQVLYASTTPMPPLQPEQAAWAEQILRQHSLLPPASK